MSCLAPCPACNRHVSTHETACPFCAAALPESFRCQPARALPPGRLSRAAMIAAGAALVSVQACSTAVHYGTEMGYDAGASTMDAGANDSAAESPGAAPAQLEQTPPDESALPAKPK